MPQSVDEKILVVSYAPSGETVEDEPAKVTTVIGEYIRTEPGCFRKEGGGKINFKNGYWTICDRLGQTITWVEGGIKKVPQKNWQTRGEGFLASVETSFGMSSAEPMAIFVDNKMIEIPEPEPVAKVEGTGCSEGCAYYWAELKEKIPHEHRQRLETYEAQAIVHRDSLSARVSVHHQNFREKASEHAQTAKETYDEYTPVVKRKGQEAYTACFEFWTHPDTQDTMKKAVSTTVDCFKFAVAGCLAVTAGFIDQIVGNTPTPAATDAPATAFPVVDNDQAMDASYIKLDSGSPVIVDCGSPVTVESIPLEPASPLEVHSIPKFSGDSALEPPPDTIGNA